MPAFALKEESFEEVEAKAYKKTKKKKSKAVRLSIPEQQELIVEHQEDSIKIAWKLLNRWRVTLPQDDVQSIAGISLCEAASRFDPSYETSFRTFYFYYLRGRLIKEISQIVQDKNVWSNQGLPGETDGDVTVSVFSQNVESPLVERATPESLYESREIAKYCSDAIENLDDLEKEVIRRYFGEDTPITQVAKDLGYCRCHLSRVKNNAIKKLNKVMEGIKEQSKPAKALNIKYSGGRGRRKTPLK